MQNRFVERSGTGCGFTPDRAHDKGACWEKPLVIEPSTGQIGFVKATLTELHRDTAKLVRPVIDSQKTLVITERGEARAKIVPLPKKPDRKKALAVLRSMAALELPSRE